MHLKTALMHVTQRFTVHCVSMHVNQAAATHSHAPQTCAPSCQTRACITLACTLHTVRCSMLDTVPANQPPTSNMGPQLPNPCCSSPAPLALSSGCAPSCPPHAYTTANRQTWGPSCQSPAAARQSPALSSCCAQAAKTMHIPQPTIKHAIAPSNAPQTWGPSCQTRAAERQSLAPHPAAPPTSQAGPSCHA